jgi:hypothetical protein
VSENFSGGPVPPVYLSPLTLFISRRALPLSIFIHVFGFPSPQGIFINHISGLNLT